MLIVGFGVKSLEKCIELLGFRSYRQLIPKIRVNSSRTKFLTLYTSQIYPAMLITDKPKASYAL